jgi:hypothetical protein
MTRLDRSWPSIVVLSTAAVWALAAADESFPLRSLVVAWFLLFCPGMALVGLLQLGDGWRSLALALPLSAAIDTIVAGSMLYAGAWSPIWALLALTVLSLGGAALELRRTGRAPAEVTR